MPIATYYMEFMHSYIYHVKKSVIESLPCYIYFYYTVMQARGIIILVMVVVI